MWSQFFNLGYYTESLNFYIGRNICDTEWEQKFDNCNCTIFSNTSLMFALTPFPDFGQE